MKTRQFAASGELIEIRRESWRYNGRRPGKVPPADSPSRPALARLWQAAKDAVTKQPNARTFSHAGWRFGVVFADEELYVVDWRSRALLVRSPSSIARHAQILRPWGAP